MEELWKPECQLRCCEEGLERLGKVLLCGHVKSKTNFSVKFSWFITQKTKRLNLSWRLALGVPLHTHQSHTQFPTTCYLAHSEQKNIFCLFQAGPKRQIPESVMVIIIHVFQFCLHLLKNKESDCHFGTAWRTCRGVLWQCFPRWIFTPPSPFQPLFHISALVYD